ncbi:MAG TPA: cytochrome c [Bryobacteraceae bacterium]|jgi:mono/diheme cytochrome c family protein|nr:cytochrome c [Bryobacteraceae bacterium]
MPPRGTNTPRLAHPSCYAAVAGVLLVLLAACEPPGKPKLRDDPQAAPVDFKTLYSQNCEACHGVGGKNGPGRILNDSLYLAILPRETLRQILIHGRPGTSMPAWAQSDGGPLNPKQIDALVDGFYKNWAHPAQFAGKPLPPYAAADEKGDPDAGRKLFARSCFMCHGPGARVGLITDPNYLSLVSDQMLRTSILIGRPDLGMPDYRNLKAGKALSSEDVSDLVAFLVSKRPADAMTAQNTAGSGSGSHVNDSGTGNAGPIVKGNEGSGHGPGSPQQKKGEGNKSRGSSQQGVK